MSLFKVHSVLSLLVEKSFASSGSSEAGIRSRYIAACLVLSLKVAAECFPLFCTVNTQAEILPFRRNLQEILGVMPVVAQEICVSVLLCWICARICPTVCQMVGVLGLGSMGLTSQTGEAAWSPAGRRWSPGARALRCGSCGAAVARR